FQADGLARTGCPPRGPSPERRVQCSSISLPIQTSPDSSRTWPWTKCDDSASNRCLLRSFRSPGCPVHQLSALAPATISLISWVSDACRARLYCRVRSEEHTSELQSREHLVCR